AALVAAGLAGGVLVAAVLGLVAAAVGFHSSFLVYAAVASPFLLLTVLQQDFYRALGEVRRMSILYLTLSVAGLVAFGSVAIVRPGNIHLALAAWAGSVAAVALGTIVFQARVVGFELAGTRRRVPRILVRGLPFSLANGIAQLNYRVDVYVVAVLLPLAQVGRYSVAIAMGEALWQLSRAVATGAYAPLIKSSTADSAALTVRIFRHTLVLLLLGAGGGLVLARFSSGLLFGKAFASVWIPLAVLLPGVVARGAAEVLQPFLMVRLERSREWLVASTVGMVLNLALALAFTPFLGITGAALSTTISYVVCAGYLAVRFRALAALDVGVRLRPGSEELRLYRRLAIRLLMRQVPQT
ncbi:MAG TPA: polysaccharide biosynthesis C-terminal domain-containing protein, partial [Galbitalea sp.]